MNNSLVSKSLSITLSATLLATSFTGMAGAGMAPTAAAMPDFVRTLTPPETLGFVDTYYQGNSEKPVILIQDLHANVGVQRKIEGLLNFYQPKVTEGGKPMVMGVEGAWGKLKLDRLRAVAYKARKGASDFLLKEAEFSGMDHFAVMSETPVEYFGIDDPEDYILHLNLFRKSLAARLELAAKVDKLRIAVNQAKVDGSGSMRTLWKMADDFHNGQIGLDDLSRALKTPISNYGQAEAALAKAQEAAANNEGDNTFKMKNVVVADRSMELLSRLFRQQLTLEEVQYVSKQIPSILVVIQAMLPGENMQLWKDTIQSAIDHYAVALLRNKPMAEHAVDLANKYPQSNTIIVTGGFHTASIADYLKAKKMSYMVIAPVVESQTAHDEALYLKRMMGLHVYNLQIAAAARALASASTVASPTGGTLIGEIDGQTVSAATNLPLQQATMSSFGAFQDGRTPTAVPETIEDAQTEQTIDTLVQGAKPVNSPTSKIGQIALNYKLKLTRFLQGGVTPKEEQIVIKDKASTSEKEGLVPGDSGEAKVTTSVGVAAGVLGLVGVYKVAEHALNRPELASVVHGGSTSLEAALITGGVALAGLGAAWFHPKGKAAIKNGIDLAKQAIINSQA